RVEIKGAQELRLIPKLVENEVLRQLSLIEIMRELKEIGFQKIECHGIDVTHIFGNAQSNITRGKETYAIKVPKMGGFLKRKLTPTRTLGNEIANYVRVKSGLKGIIHSDEDVEKYNLGKEFRELAEFIKAGKEDLLAIVSGDVKSCKSAIEAFARRVNQLVDGIPEETRKALDSGDTEYMRPLPGSARMYPETDIPPIPVERRLLDKIMKNPPELIEHKIARFVRQYKIPEELARQVVNSGFDFVFEKAAKTIMEPVLVANTLTSTLTYLRREGIPVERLSENHLMEIFRALEEGKFSKEKLPDVLKVQAEHPEIGMEKVLEKAGAGSLSIDELRKIVRDTISSNRQVFSLPNPEKALMGLVMEKVRGKIPGKIVADVLREEIKR
ncbi:MAG: GAD domain-containing protein, partial [Candidatus Aenigmatarchaeota archaeon]